MSTQSLPQIAFDSLYLEITRQCNMRCAHCLRGEPEDKKLNINQLIPILEHTKQISTIGFTGGEPTLNIQAIKDFLYFVKKMNIPVFNIYIVTNGKKITQEFIRTMSDWYYYCVSCGGDPDLNGLALSQDEFHEPIPYQNIALLENFKWFDKDDKKRENHPSLIDIGRARQLSSAIYPKIHPDRYLDIPVVEQEGDTLTIQDSNTLITVNGNILNTTEYDYQNEDNYIICSAEDPESFIQYLKEQIKN